jgi:hypothetical protein
MSALNLHLSKSLHQAARELAAEDGISVNQLVTTALAEKISALRTVEYLQERAAHADESNWERIFSAIPDTEPEEADRF